MQNEVGWRGSWRRLRHVPPSSVRMKIIFVFDELDKLDDQTEPGAQSQVEKMLTGLKNLFTTSGICFLFVAGKDLHERWLRDVSRGDSIFESVFSCDKYLPCMWANVDDLCEQFTSVDGDAGAAMKTVIGTAPVAPLPTASSLPPRQSLIRCPCLNLCHLMPWSPAAHASHVTNEDSASSSPPWLDRLVEGLETESYPIAKEITSLGRDPTNDMPQRCGWCVALPRASCVRTAGDSCSQM